MKNIIFRPANEGRIKKEEKLMRYEENEEILKINLKKFLIQILFN